MNVTAYVEEHPYQSAAIGGGVLLVLLWYFGFFSGGSQSSGGGALASYYAAEAGQAQLGAQLAAQEDQNKTALAVAGLQANAAEAIATTQANAAMTINSQNAGVSIAGATDALLATESNNETALATAYSNNATRISIADTAAKASETSKLLSSLVSLENIFKGGRSISITGGGLDATIGGGVSVRTPKSSHPMLSPKTARSLGYTSKQYTALTGLPGWK